MCNVHIHRVLLSTLLSFGLISAAIRMCTFPLQEEGTNVLLRSVVLTRSRSGLNFSDRIKAKQAGLLQFSRDSSQKKIQPSFEEQWQQVAWGIDVVQQVNRRHVIFVFFGIFFVSGFFKVVLFRTKLLLHVHLSFLFALGEHVCVESPICRKSKSKSFS